MLADSNIIIYAGKTGYDSLKAFIRAHRPDVSAISKVEVLGYHRFTLEDRVGLERFFASCNVLPISDDVIQRAIDLKQTKKMSLGDAIIAGTALAYGKQLLTHNVSDFAWISGLVVIDPIANNAHK